MIYIELVLDSYTTLSEVALELNYSSSPTPSYPFRRLIRFEVQLPFRVLHHRREANLLLILSRRRIFCIITKRQPYNATLI
jgi:hypothetical protein